MQKERISRRFPALAYSPEDKLFFLEPPSLGFGFLCIPLVGADDGLVNRFNNFLNLAWPAETILQFCLWCSPDLVPERILLPAADDVPDFLKQLRTERVEFLRRATEAPLDGEGLKVRDLKLIITARLPLARGEPGEKEMRKALELRDAALETLKTCNFGPRLMTADDYVRVMETILNWSPDAGWRHYVASQADPDLLIRDQLADYSTDLQVSRDHLLLDGKMVKLLSPKRRPDTTYFGLAQKFLMDPLTGSRGVRENVLITASVYIPDTERLRGRLEKERQWVTNQTFGPMLKFVPRLAKKKESYDVLFESLDDGDRLVRLAITVALFCDPENASGAVANLITFWREAGIQLLEDRFICLPLLLNSLPLGAEREAVKELDRYRTMTSRQALPFLPVFGGWKGTGTPVTQFVARDGQLQFFDFFDSNSNFNAVIAAQSGSGKSFLVNEIVTQYHSLGGRAWIIDIGRSYEKLTEVLGGTFMVFDAQSDICLNPFSIVRDYEDEAETLVGLVTAMAAPSEPLNNLQSSQLRRVLDQVWEQQGPEMTIDSLAQALMDDGDNRNDSRIKDIGEQLYPFTSKGNYGRFFNGPNNVNFQGDLVVIELEELRARRHLQQVVLLQLIYQIQQEMYLGERDRRKLLYVDEAWDLLTQGNVGKFIEHGYRRFRKYGGAAVVITQSVNDLYASDGGVAIAENSAYKILLGQARETIAKLQSEKRVDLGEYGFALLKTLHTKPGVYSELGFVTEQGMTVGRLYVEPFKRLLYSTRAEDVHALKELRKEGLDMMQAIDVLMASREQMYG